MEDFIAIELFLARHSCSLGFALYSFWNEQSRISSRSETILSSLVCQNRFRVDGDIDFIADYDTAAIDRILPTHAKILTIDLSSSHETRARLRPLVNSIFPPGSLLVPQIADIHTGRARN